MKRIILLSILLTLFLGSVVLQCGAVEADKAKYYGKVEMVMIDFSKKIKAHYQSQGLKIPQDFDEKQFMAVLEKVYPDQDKVRFIKDNFKIKARSINGNYAVMLCDPGTGRKILEDLSCHVKNVEIRWWNKKETCPCVFEKNWEEYCN